MRAYRQAHQESIGEVTDLLGQVFGAVQTVQVARAERHVVEHFKQVNEIRRKAALKDKLLSQMLDSVFTNAADLGTGFLLLVAAQAMQQKSFSVGDFVLFVSYLGWLTQVISMSGGFITRSTQVGVSIERLFTLLQGAPPQTLVQHNPTYLNTRPITFSCSEMARLRRKEPWTSSWQPAKKCSVCGGAKLMVGIFMNKHDSAGFLPRAWHLLAGARSLPVGIRHNSR